MIQNPMELYDEIMKVTKPEEVSYWTSDLQFKVKSETTALISDYAFAHLVTQFVSVIDGQPWYVIPFAYKPWLEGGEEG